MFWKRPYSLQILIRSRGRIFETSSPPHQERAQQAPGSAPPPARVSECKEVVFKIIIIVVIVVITIITIIIIVVIVVIIIVNVILLSFRLSTLFSLP